MIVSIQILASETLTGSPGSHTGAHLFSVTQRDHDTTDTAVFSIHNESSHDYSNAWEARHGHRWGNESECIVSVKP